MMNINKNSQTPIYRQIYNNIVDEIINGYLIPGERLVSRRVLAEKLGIEMGKGLGGKFVI